VISGKYASKYVGTLCIIMLETGETYIRKLKHSSRNNLYDLISINLDSNCEYAFLLNCKISTLAQIVWIRKNERIKEGTIIYE